MKHNSISISGIIFLLALFTFSGISQEPTVGLRHIQEGVFEGYTLLYPEKNANVYLINNCGELINEWIFSEIPSLSCYLLENGNVLKTGPHVLEMRSWDDELVWLYEMDLNGLNQHHDIEPLPNGNILCLLYDHYTTYEIIEEGRDPENAGMMGVRMDKVIELKPLGIDDAEIVWKWKFVDHLIQDFDPTKENYGVVEDHPELVDINFDNGYTSDFTHTNSIDYHEALDQIILSPRNLSELMIIDHSTTTQEAAGHSGGNSNMGGDFLWRWGNPQVYRQGGPEDQKLFEQHDGRWVDSGYLDEGKISVFNNDADGTETYSAIHLIEPVMDGYHYLMDNNRYLPVDFDWTWSETIMDEIFYESIKSGAHSLPNGNFIICERGKGQVSEISKSGEHLWTYKNPSGTFIYNQYETVTNTRNSLFRAEKYPADYPGFEGYDLVPQGLIEDQNPYSEACMTESGIDVRLYLILEGAFTGSKMLYNLNNKNLLPNAQPFHRDPWNYNGNEYVEEIPNDSIVDWVLIELRDASSPQEAVPATRIMQKAGFLLNNGRVVDLNGSRILTFDTTFTQNLYVIVWHRNHLGIMTANAAEPYRGLFTYDFLSDGQAYNAGQKDLGNGIFGMIAGDVNGNGTIDNSDLNQWGSSAGERGYLSEDVNMDIQTSNTDKNDFILINFESTSFIPE